VAVDRDRAFDDQGLARTTGTETGPGKILVQTHKVPLTEIKGSRDRLMLRKPAIPTILISLAKQ
jgi:hypothetical protein